MEIINPYFLELQQKYVVGEENCPYMIFLAQILQQHDVILFLASSNPLCENFLVSCSYNGCHGTGKVSWVY